MYQDVKVAVPWLPSEEAPARKPIAGVDDKIGDDQVPMRSDQVCVPLQHVWRCCTLFTNNGNSVYMLPIHCKKLMINDYAMH